MLDINPDGKKLILSVDGGGMRGMIPIAMLAELERLTGKPCYELFDMVCGTSIGAVIAAGFGLGLSAQEQLEQVFRRRLPEAFALQPRGLLRYVRYLLTGLRSLYDLQPFVNLIGPIATGRKMRDFTRPIVFMTARDLRTANTYFIVSKGPGAPAFADWPVVGAVAASGAAPIYFPPVLGNLIDGGVGIYSNPCLAATIEAMEYIGAGEGFRDGNVIHLSLGTGYTSETLADGQGSRYWLADWIRYIIYTGLGDSALQQVLNTRAIYQGRVDLRRYNPWLDADNVENVLGIPLKGRPDPAKLELDSFEAEQAQLMEDIGRAYARTVSWTTPNYTPWVNERGANYGAARDGGHPLPRILPVQWAGSPYQ